MNLMLTVIFLCVVVGLVSPRFGGRTSIVITLLASMMTVLYYTVERAL